jgi:regulatory protein
MSTSNRKFENSAVEVDHFTFAREVALRALGPRAKSRSEILDLLKKKNVDNEIAASVCDDLELHGYLNDLDFANQWVASRMRQKRASKTVIAGELRQKGVASDFIKEALLVMTDEMEYSLAQQTAEKKYRSISHEDPKVIKQKLAGLLARKGFSSSISVKVISELLAE